MTAATFDALKTSGLGTLAPKPLKPAPPLDAAADFAALLDKAQDKDEAPSFAESRAESRSGDAPPLPDALGLAPNVGNASLAAWLQQGSGPIAAPAQESLDDAASSPNAVRAAGDAARLPVQGSNGGRGTVAVTVLDARTFHAPATALRQPIAADPSADATVTAQSRAAGGGVVRASDDPTHLGPTGGPSAKPDVVEDEAPVRDVLDEARLVADPSSMTARRAPLAVDRGESAASVAREVPTRVAQPATDAQSGTPTAAMSLAPIRDAASSAGAATDAYRQTATTLPGPYDGTRESTGHGNDASQRAAARQPVDEIADALSDVSVGNRSLASLQDAAPAPVRTISDKGHVATALRPAPDRSGSPRQANVGNGVDQGARPAAQTTRRMADAQSQEASGTAAPAADWQAGGPVIRINDKPERDASGQAARLSSSSAAAASPMLAAVATDLRADRLSVARPGIQHDDAIAVSSRPAQPRIIARDKAAAAEPAPLDARPLSVHEPVASAMRSAVAMDAGPVAAASVGGQVAAAVASALDEAGIAAPTSRATTDTVTRSAPLQLVKTLDLHLNPAELGPVTIAMRLSDGGLQLHITASRPATARALDHDRDALSAALSGGGYALDALTVAPAAGAPEDVAAHHGDGPAPSGAEGGAGGDRREADDRQRANREPAADAADARRAGGDLYL